MADNPMATTKRKTSGSRRSPAAGKKGAAFFRLTRQGQTVRLALVDRRGAAADSDFRRYVGAQREAVREFATRLGQDARIIVWDDTIDHTDARGEGEQAVVNPEPRLLDLAAASGMLVDEKLGSLAASPEAGRLMLRVRKNGKGGFSAHLAMDDAPEEGDAESPYAVSPCHVVSGRRLVRVRDLGPEWFIDRELLQSRLAADEIAVFLSFALSRLPGLELEVEGYDVHDARERSTLPALIFSEIDDYDYLHIRPVSALEGFAPGFLDNRDISRVAALDEEERVIRISEILFSSDPASEFRAVLRRMGKESADSVFEEQGRFILAPDFAERFLSEQMGSLVATFALYESAKLARYKIRPVKPRLKLRLSSGIDFFEGEADVEVDGESLPFSQFMADYRRQAYITLSDGTRAYPDPAAIARMRRLIRSTDGDEPENVRISFFDFPALLRSPETVELTGDGGQGPESFYRGYNGIVSREDRFSVEGASLRPYQAYGAKWLDYLREHGFGACLADEMGLGKTVQAIALLRAVYAEGEQGRSLVVAPTSLLQNWTEELRRFAPELEVALWYGSDRGGEIEAQIVITSYAVMRLDIDTLSAERYAYVVLDESQSIKNLETKTAQAALQLDGRHKLALSGTPVENSLEELYSLFGFLNRGLFGTQSEFLSTYVRPIREQGDEEALRDLRSRIYPFILRRTKRDVLPDLPERSEQVSFVELGPEHLALYHRRRVELAREISQTIEQDGLNKSIFLVLQALTELRRLASVPEAQGVPIGRSAKREYLREVVPEVVETGHKCLIFANYLAAVEFISEDLAELGIGNLVMTGSTTDRSSLIDRFRTDPGIKAFIMTLKTGGLGLNLTAADYVFIFDPWWNRSAEAQAIDRTHRIGQRNPVFAYRLIARGTIEEKMLLLQRQKAELLSSLITSDAEAYKSLDEGDIDYLLR